MAEYKSTKKCSKCKAVKSSDEFSLDNRRCDGLNPHCKECVRERGRIWFQKNKDRNRQRQAKGVCTRCGKRPPRDGQLKCDYCAEQMNRYLREFCKKKNPLTQFEAGTPKNKVAQDIQPFPDAIDRESFGHWLSGFSDGEGCFLLYKQVDKKRGWENARSCFVIRLRADDIQILLRIQSYFQCGLVYCVKERRKGKKKPQVVFHVSKPVELATKIIPHFEKFPLRAKKAADFEIWKQAVAIAFGAVSRRPVPRSQSGVPRSQYKGLSSRWTPEEKAAFFRLLDALKDARKFVAPVSR